MRGEFLYPLTSQKEIVSRGRSSPSFQGVSISSLGQAKLWKVSHALSSPPKLPPSNCPVVLVWRYTSYSQEAFWAKTCILEENQESTRKKTQQDENFLGKIQESQASIRPTGILECHFSRSCLEFVSCCCQCCFLKFKGCYRQRWHSFISTCTQPSCPYFLWTQHCVIEVFYLWLICKFQVHSIIHEHLCLHIKCITPSAIPSFIIQLIPLFNLSVFPPLLSW